MARRCERLPPDVNAANGIAAALQAALGERLSLTALNASSFCATWRADGVRTLFVKSVAIDQFDVLEAEADGLAALAATEIGRAHV